MKVMLVILKVLFIGGLLIISNGELALSEPGNLEIFVNQYSNWVSKLFDNGITVVGYVVNTEWLPETNSSYSKQS
jgi:hypothetical protein|tara:strand:- start:37 stop:261 length:225 start_codon:yes stop_codon:yes gene_type:complete